MDRSELEGLDRDTLIARAEANGVTRARILTRPELVDELLVRTNRSEELPRVRGLFGRARDLLAKVIERGLHLPDAADRLRIRAQPPPPFRSTAQPLPTVTLAEIYAAQGHRERAVDTLKTLLDAEPDHAAAQALLQRLEAAGYRGPRTRTLPPEEEEVPKEAPVEAPAEALASEATAPEPSASAEASEPMAVRDDAPLSPARDADECIVIPVDSTNVFVSWGVRDQTRAYLEGARPGGALALRVLIVSPRWEGPQAYVRDLDVEAPVGDSFVRELPKGCVVRAAIGWRVGDQFVPVAHSPALETLAGDASPLLADALVRWTPRGAIPVESADRDAASIERALGILRAKAARARFGGSSEPMHEAR